MIILFLYKCYQSSGATHDLASLTQKLENNYCGTVFTADIHCNDFV